MPQVLGLDLGSYSLKGVVLEATGRGMSVLRWAETRRAEEAPLDEALAVFLAENPWAPDQVVVALPDHPSPRTPSPSPSPTPSASPRRSPSRSRASCPSSCPRSSSTTR